MNTPEALMSVKHPVHLGFTKSIPRELVQE